MNRELYASLVIRARVMAMTGGTSAQNVPYMLLVDAPSSTARALTHSSAAEVMTSRAVRSRGCFFMEILLSFLGRSPCNRRIRVNSILSKHIVFQNKKWSHDIPP